MGDIPKWTETLELLRQIYPNNTWALANLSDAYLNDGRYQKALEVAREGLRLLPNGAALHVNLGAALICLNQFDEAEQTIRQALSRNLESIIYHQNLYEIAFIRGDGAAMKQQIDWAKGKPEGLEALRWQAHTAEFGGKGRQADDFYRQAIALARQNNLKSRESSITAEMALTDALFGNCRQALDGVKRALSLSRAASENLGLALALCGEPDQALALAEEFIKANPKTASLYQAERISGFLAPIIRAMVELRRGKPDQAIQLLQSAIPFESQYPLASPFTSKYLRGQAYLGLRAGKEAAVEFQEILDYRGYDPTNLNWALAHLGSARAAALTGDTAKSRKMYEAFLEFWKDADPDIPILIAAKAEYAKLR